MARLVPQPPGVCFMFTVTTSADIAIVGMACRFAGADGLRAFWRNILSGESSISEPAAAPGGAASRPATLRGGYLHDLWRATPALHGLPGAALPGINPEQLLALELAAAAIRDAGYGDKPLPRERTAVILGYAPLLEPAGVNWVLQGVAVDQTLDLVRRLFPHGTAEQFDTLRRNLLGCLPELDSRTLPGLLRNSLAGRIANRLDVAGAAYVVDSACASALLALRHAVAELREGQADVVLTGGVQGLLSPAGLLPFDRLGLLSHHEQPQPFGREADGTLFGEGGGLLLLKRRADAERDGDRVYAYLAGVAAAADGRSKDLFQPHEESLTRALARAHQQARATPESVELIETHGSGIPGQDRAEIRALSSLYGPRRGAWPTLALGTLKAQIGHCGAAAGAAGIIKAALGLYHRILPPTGGVTRPHPALRLAETPFFLNATPRPWVHNDTGAPRRAGVATMAFGGVSAYALLEQSPGSA